MACEKGYIERDELIKDGKKWELMKLLSRTENSLIT